MLNKKLITILLCILVITSGLFFPKTIVKATGSAAIGWKQSKGVWYYLNSNGAKTMGWVQSGSKWYYLNSNGAMATGWIKSGGKWYYLNPTGAMVTGWVKSASKWYYLNPSGAMVVGWIKTGGAWYYLNSSGDMATGWIQTGGKKYYLYASGIMALNTTIQEDYLGSDGAMTDNNLTSVSLNKITDSLEVGETDTLIANITPITATKQSATWTSSRTDIATVDSTGKVTAVGEGIAIIIATTTTDGSKAASCTVSVTSPVTTVTTVILNKTTDGLTVGAKDNLIATVSPVTPISQSVTWISSNTAIVAVDNTGEIKALSEGTAIITVTTNDGSKTASCTVSVSPVITVTSVSLNKTVDTLIVGGIDVLVANVLPNTTNQSLIWKSSNSAIVIVDNTGKITAIGVGNATITATSINASKTASCSVNVTNPVVNVTSVSLNKTTDALTVNGMNILTQGGEDALIATVIPNTATNKAMIWASSNNYIASIDNTGKVRATNPGTVIITVTTADGNKTASCIVTVTIALVDKVTAINLNKATDALVVGGTDTLIATVAPSTANEAVTWTSSNSVVATVDKTGKVTALSVGTAEVICITTDGSYLATCNVIVRGKSKLTFAIDIGHNAKYDTGANGIRSEDVCNKEVGTRVMAKLINLGYNVIDCSPTNPTSTTDSLKQRCDIANAAKADYYVAIHFNSFNGSVSGSEIYIGSDGIKTKAQQVLNNIVSLGYNNRGIKDNSRGLYVLSNTDMPAMLIECAFLDSVGDMAMYNPDTLADAIVNGLIAYN